MFIGECNMSKENRIVKYDFDNNKAYDEYLEIARVFSNEQEIYNQYAKWGFTFVRRDEIRDNHIDHYTFNTKTRPIFFDRHISNNFVTLVFERDKEGVSKDLLELESIVKGDSKSFIDYSRKHEVFMNSKALLKEKKKQANLQKTNEEKFEKLIKTANSMSEVKAKKRQRLGDFLLALGIFVFLIFDIIYSLAILNSFDFGWAMIFLFLSIPLSILGFVFMIQGGRVLSAVKQLRKKNEMDEKNKNNKGKIDVVEENNSIVNESKETKPAINKDEEEYQRISLEIENLFNYKK